MAQQMAEAVVSWPKIHILKLNESCSGMKSLIFILIKKSYCITAHMRVNGNYEATLKTTMRISIRLDYLLLTNDN